MSDFHVVSAELAGKIREYLHGDAEYDARALLREVAHVAERALAHAQTAQRSGAAGVQSALARLDSLEREVESFVAR